MVCPLGHCYGFLDRALVFHSLVYNMQLWCIASHQVMVSGVFPNDSNPLSVGCPRPCAGSGTWPLASTAACEPTPVPTPFAPAPELCAKCSLVTRSSSRPASSRLVWMCAWLSLISALSRRISARRFSMRARSNSSCDAMSRNLLSPALSFGIFVVSRG